MPQEPPSTESNVLPKLALLKFGTLSRSEQLMLSAANTGQWAVCGPSLNGNDPLNDPKRSNGWDQGRFIRAELIQWVCLGHEASPLIGVSGLRVAGARITGSLDLSYGKVTFPLVFVLCHFPDHILLRDAEIDALSLQGSLVGDIFADGLRVRASVEFSNGFQTRGTVHVIGAKIGGNLLRIA